MWLMVMFDLPTDTADSRRDYRLFREMLLHEGFVMLQFSVYARHMSSEENAEVHRARIRANLPPDGQVRMLLFTDKQFEKMEVFFGKIRRRTEEPPTQLTIF